MHPTWFFLTQINFHHFGEILRSTKLPTGKPPFRHRTMFSSSPRDGEAKSLRPVDFDTKTQLKNRVKGGPKRRKLSSSPSNSFRSGQMVVSGKFWWGITRIYTFWSLHYEAFPPENCRLESENQPVEKEYHLLQTSTLGRSMLSCSYRVFWGFSRMIYHSISAPFLEYKHRALAARYASGIFHYQVSSYTYPPRWLYSNWSSTYIPGKSTSETRKWFGLHHTPLEGHQHLKMLGHLIHVNLRGPPRTACHPPCARNGNRANP